jgi:glycogen synthase
MCSRPFSPKVGGLETVSEFLAREFARQGHAVVVVTETPGPSDGFPFRVVRQPGPGRRLRHRVVR